MLRPPSPSNVRSLPGALTGGLLLTWAIAWAFFGLIYAPKQSQSIRSTWEERLTSVAADRARLVAALVESIEADARLVARFPSVVALLQASTPDSRATSHVADVLETVAEVHGYLAIGLLDSRGIDLAQTRSDSPLPPVTLPADSHTHQARLAFDGTGEAEESLLSLVVPVVWADQSPRGFVRIVVDPGRRLFPLLLNEAFPTATGETTLAAIEGGQVLPLSPRGRGRAHQRGSTDLTPLLSPSTGGLKTYEEYQDRSGRAVLAATRPVAGTDWAVVSSVDLQEALEPHRQKLAETALWLTALLAVATAAVLGAWQSRKRLSDSSATRWASCLAGLLELSDDAVLIHEAKGHILGANSRAERLYGWSRDELSLMSIADIEATPIPSVPAGHGPVEPRPEGSMITTHRDRQGAIFVAEVGSREIPTAEGTVFVLTVRNLSRSSRMDPPADGGGLPPGDRP